MGTLTKKGVSSFELELDGDKIVSITQAGRTVRLEDIVIANGSFGASAGTRGKVVRILEPFTRRTTDCIDVKFQEDRAPVAMKFKDLLWESV